MSSAILALRAAIIAKLRSDATLTGLLGGPQIYEDAPRSAVPPFMTFGDVSAKDWSTSTEGGLEQVLSLHIWSKPNIMRPSLLIADRVSTLLQDVPLALSGHNLISLHCTTIETKSEDSGRWLRTSLRFRAVTEPI